MKCLQCHFIDTGVEDAVWNIALDEVLLNSFEDTDLPILRVYSWKPSLSFGRFSKVFGTVDLDETREKNISYVRRITGGGILVHSDDISYSLILPRNYLSTKGVEDNYRYLSQFIINIYQELGLYASYAGDNKYNSKSSNICLASNEKYDILIDGKKIGGNAQRYKSKTLFQQGSIPININESLFEPVFLEDSGLLGATSLKKLEKNIGYKELSELLKDVFSKTFNIKIIPYSLSSRLEQKVEELISQKYSKDSWNLYGK
ncbi:MAG: biotin/lipoate A/B protein ligase family protein [Campylobacterota bacterium]|nr:biotin/lipoate A/B protein ligase family protein [Campylobacterota bacterium]